MKIEDWNWSEETPEETTKIEDWILRRRNGGLALAETGESEWTQSSVQFR
jgi:hypothetical protein